MSAIACTDLARLPALGRCPAGAGSALVEPGLAGSRFVRPVWPAAVSIGTAFGTAYLYLRAQLSYARVRPGMGYLVAVLVGLAASLLIVVSTLPALRRVTGAEAARND